MRSFVTAIVAAIEAAAVALAGFVVVAVPVLLMWLIVFQMGAEPGEVVSTSAAIWLLAHFVPMQFSFGPEAALSFGLPAESLTFAISLAPLGITLLTVLWACRSGSRLGQRGGYAAGGVLGGAIGFAAVAAALAVVADSRSGYPVWLATLVVGLVYACAAGTAFVVRAARDGAEWWEHVVRWLQRGIEALRLPAAAFPRRAAETFRLAAGALALFVGAAGLGLALAILLRYGDAMALTQQLQLDALGAVVLFVAQLMLLPVAVMWSGAWLTGAGFSVGIGTSATPFEALLGPVPALPLFGVIPQGWGAFGAIAPALLVLGGLFLGVFSARQPEARRQGWIAALAIPVCAALLLGLVVALFAVLSGGAIGPDRLQLAGAQPWLTGGLAALEIGGGMLLGVVAARIDLGRVRALLPESLAGAEIADKLGVSAMRRRFGSDEDAKGVPGDSAAQSARGDAFGAPQDTATGAVPTDEQVTQELSDVAELRESEGESSGRPESMLAFGSDELGDDIEQLGGAPLASEAAMASTADLTAHAAAPTPPALAGDTSQIDEAELVQAFAWEDQDLGVEPADRPSDEPPSLRRWLGLRKGDADGDREEPGA